MLAEAQQRLRTDREKQALDLITRGLAELAKIESDDPNRRQALAEFQSAFGTLQQRLAGAKPETGRIPPTGIKPPAGPRPGTGEDLPRDPNFRTPPTPAPQAAWGIGTVSEVSPEGHIRINLGEANVVREGQTVEVVRLGNHPTYIGRLKIAAVRDSVAVGSMITQKQNEAVRPGDWVIPRIEPRETTPPSRQ
jgi:hypothetical protein